MSFGPIAGEESARYVRKAMSHCVPRELICEEMFYGNAEPGITGCPTIATVFNDSLTPYEYNMDLALEYMRMAGYDAPTPTPTPSVNIGLTFPVFLSIIAFVGATSVIVKRTINTAKMDGASAVVFNFTFFIHKPRPWNKTVQNAI